MVKRGKKLRGGEGSAFRPMSGGHGPAPLSPGPYSAEGSSMTGGSRKKRGGSKKRRGGSRRKGKKGGDGGVIATAAVPFGLLALQRYFKGSKTSKQGVARFGKSVRRTFRRRR